MTNIVLTMAGKYSRFRLFGSKVPKYLLPLGRGTMLSEVIKNLKQSSVDAKIYLIANRNDQIFFPIVRSIMTQYGIEKNSLLYIDNTHSQLETALYASDLLTLEDAMKPIVFANIDTVLMRRENFFQAMSKCVHDGGLVDIFRAKNKQYSYVRVESDGRVLDMIDKSIISDYACSGLYGFGSQSIMSNLAIQILKKNATSNFTELYRQYISTQKDVRANFSEDPLNTIVLGTPEEYVINIHRFG